MSEVVRLKRPRNETVRGVARQLVTEATRQVKDPSAVVVIAMNASTGEYAVRMTNDRDTISPIDVYGRAIALMNQSQMQYLVVDSFETIPGQ